jgi:RimJ/RimL family protein N-acetyltransferase
VIRTFPGLLLTARKPEHGDIATIAHWLCDESFVANLYGAPDGTFDAAIDSAYGMLNANAADFSPNISLIASKLADQSPVGLIMLNNIDWRNRVAELNVAIGNASDRGKYYGPDLWLLSLLYGFFELNLRKLFGYVYEYNQQSHNLSLAAGELEGVLRQHRWAHDRCWDVMIYGLTKKRFSVFIEEEKDGLLRRHCRNGLFQMYGCDASHR